VKMSLGVLEPPTSQTLLELLEPEIEATIRRLHIKKFHPDPIAGRNFSRIVSVTSSAYKRHGNIIEKALLAQLTARPELTVWSVNKFHVPKAADLVANLGSKNPSDINENDLDYCEGGRTLQIDAIIYHKEARTLRAYEIKRGFGNHDSQKKKDLIQNARCVRLLLKSYGQSKGLNPVSVSSHIIFYYDKLSVPPPIGIKGSDLDAHFGFPVRDAVETVNERFGERFRACLMTMLSQ
jgi:hypothetical protein